MDKFVKIASIIIVCIITVLVCAVAGIIDVSIFAGYANLAAICAVLVMGSFILSDLADLKKQIAELKSAQEKADTAGTADEDQERLTLHDAE